jgi:enoyl-CoA hydratase
VNEAAETSPRPPLLVEVADRVATLTLNRPDVRNALNRALGAALWDAVIAAGADPAVDVVVLTGTDPAFCAGVDLKEVAAGDGSGRGVIDEPGQRPGRDVNGLYRFTPVIDKPVIAAINGVCVTGGLELALQCTLRIASEQARFGDTHARVGIMPGGGMTVLLAQAVGWARAVELSLTGDFVGAETALQWGLVNHVVAHDDLLPFAHTVAAHIASNDQSGVRRLLRHYRRIANAATLDEAHLMEGYLAETWAAGTRHVAERFDDVVARGRAQSK